MDRARRTTQRRKPLGASASPQSASEASFDLNYSTSPTTANAGSTPQTAPQGRRGSKPLHHAFTFSTPGPHRNLNLRKQARSKTMDNYLVGDDDEDGPRKGGHSLRKRARVDYTFEHIDDEVVVPNSTSSARGRKRRGDGNYEGEDFFGTDSKRRGASMGADTPSTRRRNPSRKSAEMKAYRETLEEDDNDVQDTIEVGVSYSDVDESEFPSTSLSTSPHSEKAAPVRPEATVTQPHENHANHQSIEGNDELVQNSVGMSIEGPVEKTTKRSIEQPIGPVVAGTGKQLSDETPRPAETFSAPQSSPIVNKQYDEPMQPSIKEQVNGNSQNSFPTTSPKPSSSPATQTFTPHTIINSSNHIDQPSSPNKYIKEEVDETTTNRPHDSPLHNHQDKMDVTLEIPILAVNTPAPEQQPEQQPDQVAQKATPVPSPTPILETSHDIPLSPKLNHETVVEKESDKPAQETSELPSEEPPKQPFEQLSKPPFELPSEQSSELPSEKPSEMVTNTNLETDDRPVLAPPTPKLTEASHESTQDPIATEQNPSDMEPISPVTKPSVPLPTSDPLTGPTQIVKSDTTTPDTPASPQKAVIHQPEVYKPQPAPVGPWARFTPYVEGEYVSYPEKKARSDGEEHTPEEKDTDREVNDMEPMVEDNDDNAEPTAPEAPTPALNTPTRGSPVPDSMDPTAYNSPAPAGEEADEADISESQEPPNQRRYFKYRKLRDPEEYLSALENYENMSTADLHEILAAFNVSLVAWQDEWNGLGKVVDDYENSLRRRAADAKYEGRTRNLHQHGANYEEPDFAVKGYKAKEKESMNETRYLQGQDRIMASTYGFEYDPHPSKIGKQNPETQQVGIMTRGRSLRNQPRQTAKATETDEVVGKRQRKPVQLFDPATQDVSRSSTPVPTRGRKRRNANPDGEETQVNVTTSFNTDVTSDGEQAPKRRKRGPRPKADIPRIVEELVSAARPKYETPAQEESFKPGRRGRGKPAIRYEEPDPQDFTEEEPQPEFKAPPVRRHLLTLKIPRGKNFSEPSSAITDNGDSRPSTADSESTSHTAESSYSFRPKRQKRFRDDPDETDDATQGPPKKRGRRANPPAASIVPDVPVPSSFISNPEPEPAPVNRKVHKIKVVRSVPEISRNGTPSSSAPNPPEEGGDEPPKDYKSMTKSEKMSASMKNRWANGNMAGAVEKRKATLAAKKAAQAAAEQKLGHLAPKPKGKAAAKKEAAEQQRLQLQQQQQQQQQQQHQQHQPPPQQPHPLQQQILPPPPPPPPQQFQQQHMQQLPPGPQTFVHGMPPMGYPYQHQHQQM